MKILKSFMITNAGEGDVVSFMYNEIDEETGNLISKNNRESFYPMDAKGKKMVTDMKKYIQTTRLNKEG